MIAGRQYNPSRKAGGVRTLMARENFLWGAPRIHGELLMLGFKVSQATVSRYMPRSDRRPGQSWRTFIPLQALASLSGKIPRQPLTQRRSSRTISLQVAPSLECL